MKNIPLDQAKDGMKLAQDVKDPAGNLLIKAGTVLNQAGIDRIKTRNVMNITIEEGPSLLTPEQKAQKKLELEAELGAMFADVRSQPLMNALYEAALRYHQAKLG